MTAPRNLAEQYPEHHTPDGFLVGADLDILRAKRAAWLASRDLPATAEQVHECLGLLVRVESTMSWYPGQSPRRRYTRQQLEQMTRRQIDRLTLELEAGLCG